MNRRTLLSLLAAAVAGCLAEPEKAEPQGDDGAADEVDAVEQVSVSGENHTPQAAVNRLTVEYATDTVSEIQPPDDRTPRPPDPGNKYVVVRAEITAESDLENALDVYGSVVALQADGIIHDGRGIRGVPDLTETITSEATYDGWNAYEVPEDTTEATLVASDPDAWFDRRTEIRFEESDDLTAQFP